MNDDELRAGPFTFRDGGLEDGCDDFPVEVVLAQELTPGNQTYFFDRPYAEAIKAAIAPFAELFHCKENDTKDEPHGRGDLRLYPLRDRKAWGALAGMKKPEEYYPLARIIMDAPVGMAVTVVDKTERGRRDYRRANLAFKPNGKARTATRTAFLDSIHKRMLHLQGKDAAARHHATVQDLFCKADILTEAPGTISYIADHNYKETAE